MIKGGTGGGHTVSGLHFEGRVKLSSVLKSMLGYSIQGDEIFFNKKRVARLIGKNKLYVFLKEKGVKWESIIPTKLLPDEALFVYSKKKVYIIEIKFQTGSGSVDEKLQTCDFKKKEYTKLFSPLKLKVDYLYVLNYWFKDKRYKDVLKYIHAVGCKYYFDEIPLKKLGLPTH